MPPEARVVIFEDDLYWRGNFKEHLIESGHTVVGEATNFDSSVKVVAQLEELGANVVVMDGALGGQPRNLDGLYLISKIRGLNIGIKIVGMSSSELPTADVDLGKENYHLLGETVTRLEYRDKI
jgi:hypothetical protein